MYYTNKTTEMNISTIYHFTYLLTVMKRLCTYSPLRVKKFNPSSIARFFDPTIKLNLHKSRFDFNRYSRFNFVCRKSWIENCFVSDVTCWQEI